MKCLGFTLNYQRFNKNLVLIVSASMSVALGLRILSTVVLFIEFKTREGIIIETVVNYSMVLAQLMLFLLYFHALLNIRIRYQLINVIIRYVIACSDCLRI